MSGMRPTRAQMVRLFFRELADTITPGDTEAQIALNTRACEIILADHIKHFDRFYRTDGPGVMCINLAQKDSTAYYLTQADCHIDLETAQSSGHTAIAEMLSSVIDAINGANFSQVALVMLIDNSRNSLLAIPREHPARAIQQLQEELTV